MKLNIVPAKTGLAWVGLGIRTFFRQPLAMSGLFFLFLGAASLLSLVPMLGSFLVLPLIPAATLGLMAATRQASEGRFPMPSVLASAFSAGRERLKAMLTLGVLYTFSMLLVTGLTALIDGGDFAGVYLHGNPMTKEMLDRPEFQQAVLVGMVFNLPLTVLFWPAPALVHWHGIAPAKSLFFSALACWKNKWALLMFMAGWLGVFIAGGVTLGLIGALVGNEDLSRTLMALSMLLMIAMFLTSTYFIFRDSFVTDAEPTPQP